jgi:hypothetical protein
MSRKRRRLPPPHGPPLRDSLYPTLDLHGDTADAARSRAERWLRAQQSAGERTVRLITGRGLHSIGPPVLPREIEHLLATLKGSLVSAFHSEPGGGVYRVELKRPRSAPLPSIPKRRSLPDDPALRHRAEESLADLGVTPTPALVEAEMERLLKEKF